MDIRCVGECTLVVREPPAGPAKIELSLTRRHFSVNLVNFGVMTKSFLPEGFRPRNRIETTNAFLDSLLPKEGRKIAPERLLFGNRCDICIFVIGLPNLLTPQLRLSFPRQPYYSSSGKGSTSHVVGPNAPLWCVSPRQAEGTFPKIRSISES